MKNMLLIVNPYSGQKKAVKLLAEIIAMFNRADYAVQVYMTAGPGDATDVVARACERAGVPAGGGVDSGQAPRQLVFRLKSDLLRRVLMSGHRAERGGGR